MLLAGKKVVVVGGSSGIGLATAELAKAEGRRGRHCLAQCREAEGGRRQARREGDLTDVTNDDSVVALFSAAARSTMSSSPRRN